MRVKTRADYEALNAQEQVEFKKLLAGACVKQKEEDGFLVDYFDFTPLAPFGLAQSDLELPELERVEVVEQKELIPTQISPAQAEVLLSRLGKLEEVLGFINSLGSEAVIKWNRMTYVDRNDPITLGLKEFLDYTDEQVDEMFIEASKI